VYPIYDVSGSLPDRPETLGSKAKSWLIPSRGLGLPSRPHLFKVGRSNTGENWAEKACCEILKQLMIPCAAYEFAIQNGTHGVLSESFLPRGGSFIPANMILSRADSTYDGSLRFRQARYTLLAVLGLLRMLALRPQPGLSPAYQGMAAHEVFIGYLLFDAMVGNTDRHHENWGVVVFAERETEFEFYLAPSFDHASSLGRDQTEQRCSERLNTRDTRANVEAYAERARSAFYGQRPQAQTLTGREVVQTLVQAFPQQAKFWSDRLVGLDQGRFEHIFRRMPRDIISEDAVRFALRMLAYNRQMIREVALGSR
jgi:hypothetical protein